MDELSQLTMKSRPYMFSGANPLEFNEFKGKFKAVVDDMQALGILDGSVELPALRSQSGATAWFTKNRAIYSKLVQWVTGEAFNIIEPYEAERDGLGAYDALVERFDGSSDASTMDKFVEFVTLQQGLNEDPDTSILKMERLASQLKTLKQPVTDLMLKGLILRGLNSDYDVVKTVVASLPDVNMAMLKSQVRRHKDRLTSERTGASVSETEVNQTTGLIANQHKRLKCHNCGKYGHIRANCNTSKVINAGAGRSGKWCKFHNSATKSVRFRKDKRLQ